MMLKKKKPQVRYTYDVSDIRFSLTSFQIVFVKNSTRVKLGSPDKLLVVKQSIHPDNAGIVLNVSEQFVSMALVKWIQKTSDFSIISYVEHSIFWSCPVGLRQKTKENLLNSIFGIREQFKHSRYTKRMFDIKLQDHTFCYAVAIDLLIISVTCALIRSFSVCAIMRTCVKLQTLIYLWKKEERLIYLGTGCFGKAIKIKYTFYLYFSLLLKHR